MKQVLYQCIGGQLSFIGDVECAKNYLIKNKTGDIINWRYYCRNHWLFLPRGDEETRKQGLTSVALQTIDEQEKSMNIRLISKESLQLTKLWNYKK